MNCAVLVRDDARRAVVLRDGDGGMVVFGQPLCGAVVVRDSSKTGVVVSGFAGPSGPKGAPGDSSTATGRAVVPFAFGDASPVPIFTPAANCTDILVRLVIDTPFDGAGAQLMLGTAAQPDALMPANHNDPGMAGGYEAAPDAALVAGVPIVLTIVPGGGATQGAGRAIFDAING